MLFSCGERCYAVDVNAVDEISELLPEYPLPDSFRFLRGVVNIHGKLAVVLDLSLYLGTRPVKNGLNLILLKIPDTGLALVVSQLERIILADEIMSAEPGTAEFEEAILTLKAGTVVLLSLGLLVDSIEKAIGS